MKAKLQPVQHADAKATFKGILVYNFTIRPGVYCIDTKKIVNDRVKSFPAIRISRAQRPAKETDVTVAIVVDGAGKVFYSLANRTTQATHKSDAEKIALKTVFWMSPHGMVKARALLVLRFHPDGRVTLPKIPAQK